MRRLTGAFMVCAASLHAQGRGGQDWTTSGSDAQRSSWIRTDNKISAASMQKPGFQFLWKVKLANDARLSTPVLNNSYIGYRGFRSYGFVGGSSDNIFVLDTDLGRIEWQKRIGTGTAQSGTAACPGGMTANLSRPTNFAPPGAPAGRGGGGGRGGPAKSGVGEPGQGAITIADAGAARGAAFAPPGAPGAARGGGGGGGGGRGRTPEFVYAISADGMFHAMYISNGHEPEPPVRFLPPNANAAGLIVSDGVAYALTTQGCGGVANGVWALDLASKQVASWSGNGGVPAFGPDGTLYVSTAGGDLVALEAKTLKVKETYSAGKVEFTSSPAMFEHKGKTVVAAAARDGRIHMLDAGKMVSGAANVSPGALATWQDPSGTRWILTPAASAITAWKVADQNGVLTLQQGWTSRDIASPQPPMVMNGVVFAVSGGPRAILYALDGATGNPLWNSANTITAAARGGLSGGGSQVYLTTQDGTLHVFGFPIEH